MRVSGTQTSEMASECSVSPKETPSRENGSWIKCMERVS